MFWKLVLRQALYRVWLTALLFAALGHNVAVTGRRVERLQELKAEVEHKDLPGHLLPGVGIHDRVV